jgi:hypothetical protein
MMLFEDVKAFIDENILHSAPFDAVEELVQRKAVKNAENVLLSIYKSYGSSNPLPVEAIAYQSIFLLGKDDSALRADAGATYVGFNGVSMNFAQKQRSVAPDVIRILGRRTGSYGRYVSNTSRGMYDQ